MTFRLIAAGAVRAGLRRAALPAALLVGLTGAGHAATPADATGTFLTEDGRARIRMEKCGPAEKNLCGYVVWLKVPLNDKGQPRVDFKNPDPKKQARASLGHQLILGLKPNADARYEGRIYNSEDGKSYDVTIWSEAPGELTVRGCLIAFLCKSQTWNKVSDVLPGQLTGPTNGPGGPRSDPEWLPAKAAATGSTAAPAAPKPAAKPAAAPKAAE
ncbi:DUF2147 domain-containing protein [Methylobacterium gregans]|uniref:DUF2147 domain-containing protein n=1 Tax=Methylobacterium gregans TaxID=374424 RepID=A0AA37HQD4_9HYPH|nr:DUF2147 domain-containing protein [Methylobacterium gregans]MDQ0522786.1 uncharacterized protein (DUF2147 family) [Methylobacterium gregans]GJD79641.1 hypothetical protein NBEOAGPD_2870 [Methylobacterium gregans]GLS55680.1 hypothetical protein GCM10007886_38650 [Methylobacterium gregans]